MHLGSCIFILSMCSIYIFCKCWLFSRQQSCLFQGDVQSPVKPNRVILPSSQKADFPPPKPTLQPAQSPLKSSTQGAASTSTTHSGCSSSASVPQSPLKNQIPSRGLNTFTPLHDKPSSGSTAHQEKLPAGTPGK